MITLCHLPTAFSAEPSTTAVSARGAKSAARGLSLGVVVTPPAYQVLVSLRDAELSVRDSSDADRLSEDGA